MNVGGKFYKANRGRAHRMASLIGGTRCCRSGSWCDPRRCTARSGSRRSRGNWRATIFGAHAHHGTIALNLNLAEARLMESLNQNGNEGVKKIAQSFGVV